MTDPSGNLEDAIAEYHKNWPLRSGDIKAGQVVHPSIISLIWTRLKNYCICKLIGPPRSGKTYLAFLVGLEIEKGEQTLPFRKVRYLDLASVRDPNDIDNILGKMDKRWLFIIDNCHLSSNCHSRLLYLLQHELKEVGLMLIETRFTEDKISELSPLLEIKEDVNNAPINVGNCLGETAKGMLELHIQKCFGIGPEFKGSALIEKVQAKGGQLDKEDYQSALGASTEFKTMKRNLRFLSWRLQAWNPLKGHLHELSYEELLVTVRQTLVYPCQEYVGTLEKVAALAQWEVPYLRPAGTNPLAGSAQLEKRNIIALKQATAWQMDSTDAHLVMLANFGQEWVEKSLELIKIYLSLFPEQTQQVIGNLLIHAKPEMATNMVSRLLQVPELMKAEKTQIARFAKEVELDLFYLRGLTKCLLRDLDTDKADASRRIGIVAELMPNEIMFVIGQKAQAISLVSVIFFLRSVSKMGANAREMRKAFFDGYGTENLVEALSSSRSFSIYMAILNSLGADNLFVDVISKIPMKNLGEYARNANFSAVMWFLKALNKALTAADDMKKCFLDGYGRGNFASSFRTCKSWAVRDEIMKQVRGDPVLFKQLRTFHYSVAVLPRSMSFATLVNELKRGCIESGARRYRKINMLEEVDEFYILDSLRKDPKPASRLELLLYTSLWLDRDQAKRLAGVLPRIWTNLTAASNISRPRETDETVHRLALLLNNCWLADHRSGEELLDILRARPLHSQIALKNATGIGSYLRAMERVSCGTISEWCLGEADYLLKICEMSSPDQVDQLLVVLATSAPKVLKKMMEVQKTRAYNLLLTHTSNVSSWVRLATLNLCGLTGFNSSIPDLPEPRDIIKCGAAEAISVIYGLQTFHGSKLVSEFLDELSMLRELNSWIPLQIGRALMSLQPEQVSMIMRATQLLAPDPKTNSLDAVVLIVTTLKWFAWPRSIRLDAGKQLHCALGTAMHEGILKFKIEDNPPVVTISPNSRHPFIRKTLETLHTVTEPVRTSHLSLRDWDRALYTTNVQEQADHYRAKLLETGLLTWKVEQESGNPLITFGMVEEPDLGRLRAMIAPSASPDRA